MMACAETPLPREQRFIDQAPCAAHQVQFTRVNDTDTRHRLRITFSVAQPWKFDPKADLVSHLLFLLRQSIAAIGRTKHAKETNIVWAKTKGDERFFCMN